MTTELSLENLPNPVLRYFLATRPAFLTVTLVGALLGLASAWSAGISLRPAEALVTLLFALIAQASANVINDYYDARNGTDAANTEHVFPFTGGSRFIQNGILTQRAMAIFGFALLAAVVPAGIWLTAHSAPWLVAIGMAGVFTIWAYSGEPIKLVHRGLGEAAITICWLLVVVGSDYVQRGAFDFAPVAAGLGYALLVANLLYINQFPDFRADAHVGKRTMVVRLGRSRARWGYAALAGATYVWLTACIALGALPWLALAVFAAAPLSWKATNELWRHAETPAQLTPAIKLTIGAAHAHGLLLAVALVVAKALQS